MDNPIHGAKQVMLDEPRRSAGIKMARECIRSDTESKLAAALKLPALISSGLSQVPVSYCPEGSDSSSIKVLHGIACVHP